MLPKVVASGSKAAKTSKAPKPNFREPIELPEVGILALFCTHGAIKQVQ